MKAKLGPPGGCRLGVLHVGWGEAVGFGDDLGSAPPPSKVSQWGEDQGFPPPAPMDSTQGIWGSRNCHPNTSRAPGVQAAEAEAPTLHLGML